MTDVQPGTVSPITMPTTPRRPLPVVVLVSGSGTLLQALLADPAHHRDYEIVGVGADRDCLGLERAVRAGVATFTVETRHFADRAAWDTALADAITRAFAANESDEERREQSAQPARLVVSAGFMKILGAATLTRHTVINTHPALLPSFPGAHGVRDALAYGVKVTGTTCHVVDAGVDTGPIIEQRVVAVRAGDDEESLHERIKVQERDMLVDVVRRMARGWFIYGRTVSINE